MMMSSRATGAAATLTVLAGVGLFLAVDVLRSETRVVTFDTEAQDVGPLEAINGAPFPRERGSAIISEPLAHIRLPLKRTLLGKQLVIRPRFHVDEGDVLEVGVKKTAFWLDYDRLPLEHRLLDHLLVRDEDTWSALRSGTKVVYLNPAFENPRTSVADFERRPPTDGPIGVYGHATLATQDSELRTLPFRVTDDPDTFRAIYALYPEAERSDPEWTVNEQRFDLARAYQNEDGSIEIMFFVQRADGGPARRSSESGGGPIRLLMDSIEFRIEPGWPSARDLLAQFRRSLVRLLRRPGMGSE